jgi:cation-transporting ATPase E
MPPFGNLKLREFWQILYRNVFLITNGIIFSVVALLFVFGQFRAATFLGIISLANIIFGLSQDINAWLSLEKLQLLTAPHVLRVNEGGTKSSILAEEVERGDRIALKIGDQVPCDSVLTDALGFEVNEGLITGESSSLVKQKGDHLLAGSVVTAGSGQVQVETVFRESRIARMTEGIKVHSLSASPIQQSLNKVVRYAGYVLVVAIAFAIARGIVVAEPVVSTVLSVGTLASMLVPQGLIFAVTLFFAYGAANLFRKNVLLQEINATEKLGRIKNLCMDKTGTLTENTLTVEAVQVAPNVDGAVAESLVASYIHGTVDTSETLSAVAKFLKNQTPKAVVEAQPFSSWRQYGAVRVESGAGGTAVFVGSPDAFLPHLLSGGEREWLTQLLRVNASEGKRVLCVAQCSVPTLPKDLSTVELSIVAVFVFHNNIREGISDTVNFFQGRGVHIRIISGDNPETVSAVAKAAGVNNPGKVITGGEIAKWSALDFERNVGQYTVFARIVPEQKEKIIEAFKKDGFTAMVGDGANDALAIKKADLGIAMFDGAPATRQLAAIVLVNNSFTALPGGVELADGIIRDIETFSSVVLNQTLIGLFLFVALSLFGYAYPLTPFNVTLINYFTIGIPSLLISYWTIYPSGKAPRVSTEPFLARVMPFAAWSAVIQTVGVALMFAVNAVYFKVSPPNTIVLLAFTALSFTFFACAPAVYQGALSLAKRAQIFSLALAELVLLVASFHVPLFLSFFNVTVLHLSVAETALAVGVTALCCGAQVYLAARFAVRSSV